MRKCSVPLFTYVEPPEVDPVTPMMRFPSLAMPSPLPNGMRAAAHGLIAGIVLSTACTLTIPAVGHAEPGIDSSTSATASGSADVAATGRAGQRINVDPRTGARVAPSAPIAGVPPDPSLSTSHEGLVEEAAPGGGVMIHLQGRFRSAATVTVGGEGKPSVDCVPPGTAARE